MEQLHAIAAEASKLYEASFRRSNIVRAQNRLRDRGLSRTLIDFYLDEIELEVAAIYNDEEMRDGS